LNIANIDLILLDIFRTGKKYIGLAQFVVSNILVCKKSTFQYIQYSNIHNILEKYLISYAREKPA
jgi:hypothetical protein